jgi:hypothetical protein
MRTLFILTLLAGCSEYEFAAMGDRVEGEVVPPEPDEQFPGQVSGRICGPGDYGWVADAKVSVAVDTNGDGFIDLALTSHTDAEGYFLLEGLPPGEYTIYVEKGSFTTLIQVVLSEGEAVFLDEPECVSGKELDIAVLQGSYDKVEELLDALGLEYDLIPNVGDKQEKFLASSSTLGAYDLIFLNCGMDEDWRYSAAELVGANIKSWVQGGGSLYASDWAFHAIEASFPQAIDFWGADAFPDEAYGGEAGYLQADVLDATMQAVLGSNTAMLNYDLSGWAVAEGAADQVEILLTGSAPIFWTNKPLQDAPLAVKFENGGRVVFTTFHNEAQITEDMEIVLKEMILTL